MKTNPLNLIDFYKADHRRQYPNGTSEVYSNFTPRSNQYGDSNKVVFFGLQYFIKEYLINIWNKGFFERPLEEVMNNYNRRIKNSIGKINTDHVERLHKLGYLPIKIKALEEGTEVPMGGP